MPIWVIAHQDAASVSFNTGACKTDRLAFQNVGRRTGLRLAAEALVLCRPSEEAPLQQTCSTRCYGANTRASPAVGPFSLSHCSCDRGKTAFLSAKAMRSIGRNGLLERESVRAVAVANLRGVVSVERLWSSKVMFPPSLTSPPSALSGPLARLAEQMPRCCGGLDVWTFGHNPSAVHFKQAYRPSGRCHSEVRRSARQSACGG